MVADDARGETRGPLVSPSVGALLRASIAVFVVAGAASFVLSIVAEVMQATQAEDMTTTFVREPTRGYLLLTGIATIAGALWRYAVGAMLALIGVMLYRSLRAGVDLRSLVEARRSFDGEQPQRPGGY